MRSWIHPYLERRKQEAIVSARCSSCIILAMFLLGTTAAAQAQIAAGLVTPQNGTSSSTTSGSGSSGPAAPATQNSYQGSVPGKLEPGVAQISLQNAIDRGLKANLGLLLSGQDVVTSRGERWKKLSALLPNVTTTSYAQGSQVDLAEFGFNFKTPPGSGFTIPSIVGPFGYFDARALRDAVRSGFEGDQRLARRYSKISRPRNTPAKDARDLVVLAVGYYYLQAIADASRIETVAAQVNTAQALYQSGLRSSEGRNFSCDRWAARASGIENAPAAIDPGEK